MSRLMVFPRGLWGILAPFGLALSASAALAASNAGASSSEIETSPKDSSHLRICASANQLPYSSNDQSGFENKIAKIVANAMGRSPEFVFAEKPAIYLVRDWLDKQKCDVVIGLDSGDQRVLTTKPYYRAGYVFVTRKDRSMDFDSWNDPKIKSLGHIAVELGSPSEVMLKEIGRYTDNMAYLYSLVGFRSPRNQYVQISPQRMISEVEKGDADMAAVFAPDVARYVKADSSLKMVQIRDDAERSGSEKVPQQYDQSMGVRVGDTELLTALDTALTKAAPEIEQVLRDEGIPSTQSAN
jgi:mxaJ protein